MLKGIINAKSEYSFLKSVAKLDQLVQLAKSYNYQYLGLADDNLAGSYKFLALCQQNQIKPLLGLRVNFLEQELFLYPATKEGFKNLLLLASEFETNGKKIDLDLLLKHSKDLIIVITFSDLYLSHFLDNRKEDLKRRFQTLSGDFSKIFLGVKANNARYAKSLEAEFTYPVLPLSDVDFLHESDAETFTVIRKIEGMDIALNKANNLKNLEDLNFNFYDEYDFAKQVDSFLKKIYIVNYDKENFLPEYPSKTSLSSFDYLESLAAAGLQKRLLEEKNYDFKEYRDRLSFELSIIKKMAYENYFLVVWDFVRFAKNNQILIGPGRGTAGSSLVCFCLGITNINPLKYDLYFERFLNPERITSPDIDLDFPDNKRDDVIQYVQKKYGKEHVATIGTFVEFGTRSSLRDVAKVKNIANFKLTEIGKKLIGMQTLTESITSNQEIIQLMRIDNEIKDLMETSVKIEGLPRQTSTHAAGIIISGKPLLGTIPLTTSAMTDFYQTQFEADDLAELGFIKIDFLGIRNLSIIDEIVRIINSNINIAKIPLNDQKAFKLFQEAKTFGIFQFESRGIREVLKKVKPTKIEDVIAVLALYRPGPMQFIDLYVRRRNGESFNYPHPALKPLLENTFGVIVYQEQIMRLLHEFAGYSLGEADIVRRAISKKDEDTLKSEEKKFKERCLQKHYTEEIIDEIFAQIMKFANYGFNKSHSTAYAIISYQMAYLKANYPQIFYSHFLTISSNSESVVKEIISEMKEAKINLLTPDINKSQASFTSDGSDIRFSLQVRHLTAPQITDILKARSSGDFLDYSDFLSRTRLQAKALESLIFSGALDCFGLSKKYMLNQISAESQGLGKYLTDKIITNDEFNHERLSLEERTSLGINIQYPKYPHLDKIKDSCFFMKDITEFSGRLTKPIFAEILQAKMMRTKNNKYLMQLLLSDDFYQLPAVIFDFSPHDKDKLKVGNFYLFTGKIQANKFSERQLSIEEYRELKV
ncbi:MAG: DNA polymerase III subunit alpha [Erysipelotrichales bacterium]|nr:DNA polymerase III subunit alpha [Erysipelotrichales bacterium]